MLLRYMSSTSSEAVEIAYIRRLISLFKGSIAIMPNAAEEGLLEIIIEIALRKVCDD